MATLANLRTRVSAKLGLDTTAGGTDETLLDSWANEAVLDVLLKTGVYRSSATMTLTANTKDYTLPSEILAVDELYITGSNGDRPLTRASTQDLLYMRRATSTSGDVMFYAVNGANLLMVYPTPTAADTLTVYYTPRPTAMSSGAHDPSSTTYGGIPAEHHKAIEYYCLWQGGDYLDDQSSSQGQRYLDLYEKELAKIRRAVRRKGGKRLGRATVGRRPVFVTHPSQDV